jgi:hypothetical protein
MAFVTKRQAVAYFPSQFREFLVGLDVMSMKLNLTVNPAMLACRVVTLNYSVCPSPLLCISMFAPRVAIPIIVAFTAISKAALIGTCLRTKLLLFERCNPTAMLQRKFVAAMLASLGSFTTQPIRVAFAKVCRLTPNTSALVATKLKSFDARGYHLAVPFTHLTLQNRHSGNLNLSAIYTRK